MHVSFHHTKGVHEVCCSPESKARALLPSTGRGEQQGSSAMGRTVNQSSTVMNNCTGSKSKTESNQNKSEHHPGGKI